MPSLEPYAPFRIPAFRNFVFGSLMVHIGTAAQSLAVGWEIYARTERPLALGLVGLAQAIPMLILTLPAGYLADVFDRRKVLIVSMVGTTLTSVALGAVSILRGPVALIYVLLFLDSAFIRIGSPARTAILPLLVPRELFEGSVKWRTSLGHISGVVGPAIGGLIISVYVPAAYLLSAACTIGFMYLVSRLDVRHEKQTDRGAMVAKVIEGVRFVWRQKMVLGAISLDLFAVLLGGAVYLLPIFAREIVNRGTLSMSPEQILGWLRAAPAVGASVMALIMAHRPALRRTGRTLLLSVAAFGAATIVFGLSRNFWLSALALFLTGAFDNVSMVIRHGVVQLSTPNEMRGRVSAVSAIFIGSSNELGGFESGAVAQLFSPVVSVISGGIGTVLVVLGWIGAFPELRRLRSFGEIEDGSGARTAE